MIKQCDAASGRVPYSTLWVYNKLVECRSVEHFDKLRNHDADSLRWTVMKETVELEEEQNKAWLGVSKSRTAPVVWCDIGIPIEESADETSMHRVRDVSGINKRVRIAPQ